MRPCVVVAGASSGIGEAAARRFLAAGWDVAAVARRRERLERLRGEFGERCLAAPADVSREAEVRAAAGRIAAWRPRVDALVTSAGDFFAAPIERTAAAEFERIWRVTVLGKFLLVRELLPLLLAGAAGPRAIIHISSLAAHQDFPDESAYGSAMHAVIGLARSQDAELRGRGIRVSAVSPGLVRTELTERSGFSPAQLAGALPPAALAETIFGLVGTIRAGGYIAEIQHGPSTG